MKKDKWLTINYKNDTFDVKWSETDRKLKRSDPLIAKSI